LGAFFSAAFLRRPQRAVRTAIDLARGRQRTVLEQLLAAKAKQIRQALRPAAYFTGIDRTR
jgi:hypothetical protein